MHRTRRRLTPRRRALLGVAAAIGLTATTLGPAGPAQAAPGDPLRVLQWNIAGVTINPLDTEKPDNEGTMEVVDRLLQFADERSPHLVSMNETCSAQAEHARDGLADRFGSAVLHFAPSDGFDLLCTTGGFGSPRSGTALIAVGADAVTDTRSYYFNDDGTITSEPTERQAACFTASYQSSLGQTVRACAVHLNPNAAIAARQAEDFANFMTEDGLDLPLVLIGDFNAIPEYFPALYAPVEGGDGKFLEADHPNDRDTFYDGRKLDYIFADHEHFDPNLSAEVIDRTTCLAQNIDHPCSDHHALFGVLPFAGSGGNGEAPTVSAGPDVSGDEGTAIPLTGTVSDDSDGTTAEWSVETISADASATCAFARPHSPRTTVTCTDDGTFTITLTANDGVNPPVSDSAVVTVRNAPPVLTLTGPAPWALFRADRSVDLVAPFTDAANDTHTCTVDWDDPGAPEEYPATGSTCSRTHVFADAGMYTIRVTVTDDDGASDTEEVMVVVYDPDAGGANADGSFTSPPGAYVPNATITGQEWFHLTARYYGSNATVPTGTAKTWLDRGTQPTFRFDGYENGLEWLVVTPDGKIAAKGKGQVGNDSEQFGFVFYGYDGCADPGASSPCQLGHDRFRVVVWPLSSGANPGDAIRYDNRLGTSYDVDLANPQPLQSGQVLIQR